MSEVKKGKRSEASVRNEMLSKGALLLRFEVDGGEGVNHQTLSLWRSIEKKGFLVTRNGCLIPAPCHQSGNSKKKPAYETAMKLFCGRSKDPGTVGTVNAFGWPAEEQLSHLCHDDACCCYKDLEVVPQWKNLKRNYCGIDGVCDCGLEPKCKYRYLPSNVARDYDLLRYGEPKLSKKVKELLETNDPDLQITVRILPANYYAVADLKRQNRNLRIKRKREHDTEQKRNTKRRKIPIKSKHGTKPSKKDKCVASSSK